MHDESWKDGYDDWKLASPYDDGPECDHDDYDVDILDGRSRCSCGHSWYASNEQINSEIERQQNYCEWEERENRRQWWRDLWERARSIFPRRRQPRLVSDDDIPF